MNKFFMLFYSLIISSSFCDLQAYCRQHTGSLHQESQQARYLAERESKRKADVYKQLSCTTKQSSKAQDRNDSAPNVSAILAKARAAAIPSAPVKPTDTSGPILKLTGKNHFMTLALLATVLMSTTQGICQDPTRGFDCQPIIGHIADAMADPTNPFAATPVFRYIKGEFREICNVSYMSPKDVEDAFQGNLLYRKPLPTQKIGAILLGTNDKATRKNLHRFLKRTKTKNDL